MSTLRFPLVAIAAFALLFSVGCSTPPPAQSAAMASPDRAVVISGNGGSTTVFIPTSDPDKPMMLSSTGAEMCPECKAAAVKYFQTGVLDPKCSKCGGIRTATSLVTPTVGHQ